MVFTPKTDGAVPQPTEAPGNKKKAAATVFGFLAVVIVVLAVLWATGHLAKRRARGAARAPAATEDDPNCTCTECDASLTVLGDTQAELQEACNTQCAQACARQSDNTMTSELQAPSSLPPSSPPPMHIDQMSKEAFYAAMGWKPDTVHPWQRWGLVGPEFTPPANSEDTAAYIVVVLVFILLGLWAAVRSWRYNSAPVFNRPAQFQGQTLKPLPRVGGFARAIYAVVAFYFGPIYLLVEYISDRNMFLGVLQKENILPQAVPL